MIRVSHIQGLLCAILALLLCSTFAHANSSSSCAAQRVTYDFILRKVPVNKERKQVHKFAQVTIGYMPNPVGVNDTCWMPPATSSPKPIQGVSITIDGYTQELPAACYERFSWPIEAITIRPEDVELLLIVKARSLENPNKNLELAVYIDPYPERSPFHKKHDLPRIDCDIENEHVWPKDSKMHG